MPMAINKKPDVAANILFGVGGAGSGFAQGEQMKEQSRQANAQLDEQSRQFNQGQAQQALQWNADMEYRYQALQQAAQEGKLTRDQQERFVKIADQRERQLQTQRLDHATAMQEDSQSFRQNVEMPNENDQNERNRRVTRRGQDLVYDIGKKNWQSENTRIDMAREQYNSQEGYRIDLTDQVLAGRDPRALTPEERAAAVLEIAGTFIGKGRINGDPNLLPATAEETAQAMVNATDLIDNYQNYRQKHLQQTMQYAQARQVAKNDLEIVTGNQDQKVFMGPVDEKWSTPAPGTNISMYDLVGQGPRDTKAMSSRELPDHTALMTLYAKANGEAMKIQEESQRKRVYEEFKLQHDDILKRGNIQSAYYPVYEDYLKYAVYKAGTQSSMTQMADPRKQ